MMFDILQIVNEDLEHKLYNLCELHILYKCVDKGDSQFDVDMFLEDKLPHIGVHLLVMDLCR